MSKGYFFFSSLGFPMEINLTASTEIDKAWFLLDLSLA